MKQDYILMYYYIRYLKEVRKLKESSVVHYTQALGTISKMLVSKGKIKDSIYEIRDINDLLMIKEYLYNDSEFLSLDIPGHRMYSSGLNNYYRFASGQEFLNIENDIKIMDIEIPKKENSIVLKSYWKRSSIIKTQAIKSAKYNCEIDEEHKTFISKSTGEQYMEGHHAIPMSKQPNFDVSLDVYANIVCLCPICHRLLHYGEDNVRDNAMDKIYYSRADRLANSGIRLSKDEFREQIL